MQGTAYAERIERVLVRYALTLDEHDWAGLDEVFVPEAKRQYGYYVFPVLEGTRLIGRIDVKADRDGDRLAVRAFWAEAGVKMTQGRLSRLESELDRRASFAGVSGVTFAADWLRG